CKTQCTRQQTTRSRPCPIDVEFRFISFPRLRCDCVRQLLPSLRPARSPPAAKTTGTITTVGKVATDLGGAISSLPVPGVSSGVTGGVGSTVGALGPVIDSTADALSDGLGQIGTTANPVGTTAARL